jgi:hypothetical protein
MSCHMTHVLTDVAGTTSNLVSCIQQHDMVWVLLIMDKQP